MATELLDEKSAKMIEDFVVDHGGHIVRTSETNVGIEGVNFYTTIVLDRWLRQGAQVYFDHGVVNISNWPEKERVFEVRMKGNVTTEIMKRNLRNMYIGDNVISVKELRGEN